MGTRALIGYLDTDGDIRLTSTYNHYDGYPSNLGKGLTEFYNNDVKAEEITNVGYISYLDPETGKWDDGRTNKSYNQKPQVDQLPDDFNEAMMEIAAIIDSFGANYGYIWCNENEEWITVKNTGIRGMAENLEMQLAHLKGKFDNNPLEEKNNMEKIKEENMNVIDKAKEALKGKENLQAYIKSLTNDVKLNGQDAYVDYTVDDWEEDYISNGFGSYSMKEMNETFVRQMQYRAGIIK